MNNTHWQCFRQETTNTSSLEAIPAFHTGRNSTAVLIPKYFILARRTGVCLSIMDAPKRPSISHYINKLNWEKCSPNRQQLAITIMLLSRHNKPWRQWRQKTDWGQLQTITQPPSMSAVNKYYIYNVQVTVK